MAIELSDDGTMDTVLRCSECGEEFRFNYDGAYEDGNLEPSEARTAQEEEAAREEAYDAWVDSCIEEVEAEHECDQEVR